MADSEKVEALIYEIAGLRAQVDEDDQLIRHLRARTKTLNHEVRIRDAWIAERDRAIASLTERLEA